MGAPATTDAPLRGGPPSPAVAARTLAELGFLVHADLPDEPGPAVLLVALRDQPALTHFDPEIVTYWVARSGRGQRAELTRRSDLPINGEPFSWGEIRIVDRLHVSNAYLTFGGRLTAAEIDGVTIAIFESPVPILRRGGHSQGWDDAAENVGAFFGRMMIAIDFVPGFEARLAAATPEARYGAFLADLTDRYATRPALRQAQPRLWSILAAEGRRLERSCPDAIRDGKLLVDAIRAV